MAFISENSIFILRPHKNSLTICDSVKLIFTRQVHKGRSHHDHDRP